MALELLEFLALPGFWFWFQFTASCLVWVVTLGKYWLLDEHPRWALALGLLLHAAVLAVIIFFWSTSVSREKGKSGADKVETGPIRKGA